MPCFNPADMLLTSIKNYIECPQSPVPISKIYPLATEQKDTYSILQIFSLSQDLYLWFVSSQKWDPSGLWSHKVHILLLK